MTNDCNIQAAEGFTMMPNALIADQRVSLAAKALWAYIVSKPEGWTFRRQPSWAFALTPLTSYAGS